MTYNPAFVTSSGVPVSPAYNTGNYLSSPVPGGGLSIGGGGGGGFAPQQPNYQQQNFQQGGMSLGTTNFSSGGVAAAQRPVSQFVQPQQFQQQQQFQTNQPQQQQFHTNQPQQFHTNQPQQQHQQFQTNQPQQQFHTNQPQQQFQTNQPQQQFQTNQPQQQFHTNQPQQAQNYQNYQTNSPQQQHQPAQQQNQYQNYQTNTPQQFSSPQQQSTPQQQQQFPPPPQYQQPHSQSPPPQRVQPSQQSQPNMQQQLHQQLQSHLANAPPRSADLVTYQTSSGSLHTFSEGEKRKFVEFLNSILANSTDPLPHGVTLPIDPSGDALFKLLGDTPLLCSIVNAIRPGTVNSRKIAQANLGPFQLKDAICDGITGAKELGCLIDIDVSDLQSGQAKAHMVLGLVWQCVRAALLSQVNLRQHPELVAVLQGEENVETLLTETPEAALLKWFNFQLERAGHNRRVQDFSRDIKDGENYLVLMEQVLPNVVPRGSHRDPDAVNRARKIVDYAQRAGVGTFVSVDDILSGNDEYNLAFVAQLFDKYPSLQLQPTNPVHQQKLDQLDQYVRREYQEKSARDSIVMANNEQAAAAEFARKQDEQRRLWEVEEQKRREQLKLQEELLKARLTVEEAKMREMQAREEEANRAREREAEEQRLLMEEMQRRMEEELERTRRMEEERRRQAEVEMRLALARAQEEQARMFEEQKRMEEQRRQQAEEQARRREEDLRRQMEAERRQFQEAQQLAEEQQRRAAWDAYNKEQEMKHQAALAQQQALAAEQARQQQLQQQIAAQQQQLAAEQARSLQLQQQHMATVVTTQQQPPVSTTVVKKVTEVTTAGTPSKWPIHQLIITAIKARRLAKTSKLQSPDPYISFVHNGYKQKSDWARATQDPTFNQEFQFRMVGQEDTILVQIYDKCSVGSDTFMGEYRLTGKDLVDGNESWFSLASREHKADKVHGEILLRFKLCYGK